MHRSVAAALEEIDAALFSGDSFYDENAYAMLLDCLTRWQRRVAEIADEQQLAAQDASNEECSEPGYEQPYNFDEEDRY